MVCLQCCKCSNAFSASRGDIGKERIKRPTTAISLTNFARFRIRRYFEEKQVELIQLIYIFLDKVSCSMILGWAKAP